jgi:hypothetical protein
MKRAHDASSSAPSSSSSSSSAAASAAASSAALFRGPARPLPPQSSSPPGTLDLDDGEEVKLRVPDVRLVLGADAVGEGALYVTTA